MAKKNKTKASTVIGAIIGILLMVFVFNVMPYLKGDEAGFNKELVQIANEFNKSCPMVVDNETQLDNVVALPNNVLQYNYTLMNLSKEDINPEELKAGIEPGILNNVRTNPDMKMFRDKRTTLAYYYTDKNGAFVVKLTVTPEMYLN
jgi:hypothetical protein